MSLFNWDYETDYPSFDSVDSVIDSDSGLIADSYDPWASDSYFDMPDSFDSWEDYDYYNMAPTIDGEDTNWWDNMPDIKMPSVDTIAKLGKLGLDAFATWSAYKAATAAMDADYGGSGRGGSSGGGSTPYNVGVAQAWEGKAKGIDKPYPTNKPQTSLIPA